MAGEVGAGKTGGERTLMSETMKPRMTRITRMGRGGRGYARTECIIRARALSTRWVDNLK
jgi:hypothetical protein